MNEIDCLVVGAGPGGYVAAIRAAQLGMRTMVVEREAVGGRCLHHACIPAKAMLRSADVLSEVRAADRFGVRVAGVEVDFAAVAERRRSVIDGLERGVSGLLTKNGVELITGEATLVAGGVRVGEQVIRPSTATILATGSVRRAIQGVAFGGRVVGTEEAWAFSALPASLTVVGAGASGVELSSAYARLGTQVRLIEAAARILPTEDSDIAQIVHRGLREQGVAVHVGCSLEQVVVQEDEVKFNLDGAPAGTDWLVLATGRAPDVVGLGLDAAGVLLNSAGLIDVDCHQTTSLPGVYAIGDIVPGPALAHKASHEGIIAAEAAAGLVTGQRTPQEIPRATFCEPNVGSFGLTEHEAMASCDVVVGRVPYVAAGAAAVYGTGPGLVKIVARATDGEILGAHVVGSRATELIQEILNVRGAEGGIQELARTVHGHPTLSEAVQEAARAAEGWLIHG